MLIRTRTITAALALAALTLGGLTACGPKPAAPADSAAAPAAGDATLAAPGLAGAGGAAAPAAPLAPLPVAEPGVYRNGAFAARIENASLSPWGAQNNASQLTLVLSLINTSSEPMSVIWVEGDGMTIALDNGVMLGQGNNYASMGMKNCRGDVATCRAAKADDYTQIEPGQSVTINVVLIGNFGATQGGSMSSVKSGTLSAKMHLIQGSSIDKVVQISFPNFTLSNRMKG